jgi:hypothetical protein
VIIIIGIDANGKPWYGTVRMDELTKAVAWCRRLVARDGGRVAVFRNSALLWGPYDGRKDMSGAAKRLARSSETISGSGGGPTLQANRA